VQLIASPDAVQIVVAGAPNAGVSSIVETFGPFDRAPATVKVEEKT
jgi:GTP1/Obg family GTP-binding protein